MHAEDSFSLKDGIRLYFFDQAQQVELWASSLSGKEEIRIDGTLVYSGRSLQKEVEHTVEYEGDSFTFGFKTDSIRKGPFLFSMSKNGRLLGRKRVSFVSKSSKKGLFKPLRLLTLFALGGAFGFLVNHFRLEQQYWWLLVVLVAVMSFATAIKEQGGMAVNIENLEPSSSSSID